MSAIGYCKEENGFSYLQYDFQDKGKNYLLRVHTNSIVGTDNNVVSVVCVDSSSHEVIMSTYWGAEIMGGKGIYEGTEFPLDPTAIASIAPMLTPDENAEGFFNETIKKIVER